MSPRYRTRRGLSTANNTPMVTSVALALLPVVDSLTAVEVDPRLAEALPPLPPLDPDRVAQARAALAQAHGPACRVHAHDHAGHRHAAHHAVPTRDLQAFWGALGCACFAF